MGRLYWKFFIFFFLAQITTVMGVGLMIWAHSHSADLKNTGVESSQPARSVVEAAASTLQYGGLASLQMLLREWQKRPMPQVYAVSDNGIELMNRSVPGTLLRAASDMANDESGSRYVKRIKASDGHRYLIFVPERNMPRNPAGAGLSPGLNPPPEDAANPPPDPRNKWQGPPARGGSAMRMFPTKPLMVGVFVSFLFAALLAWYFAKPIRSLRTAFAEAADGHLDVRVSKEMGSRSDELTDLGREFDSMASRLSSLIQGQTRLLHHVSHELRSPLARMQMALGLARQSEEKIPSSLERIEREANRMDKLVGELLELSRLESGVMQIKKESVDVTELLTNVIGDAQFEADVKRIKVLFDLKHQFIVLGEHELLHRAIDNVLRNAIKFSPHGGKISIEADRIEDARILLLRISDHGPGVPEADLESIFQPFVRGANVTGADGHGVGLAIARQVIEAHEGLITASNQPGGGLVITIQLPFVMVGLS